MDFYHLAPRNATQSYIDKNKHLSTARTGGTSSEHLVVVQKPRYSDGRCCSKVGEPSQKMLFFVALYSDQFCISRTLLQLYSSFIFPTLADAAGTPGARQNLVNSGKETAVSGVGSFKGKIADCGTKLGEKRNGNLYLRFLGVTLPGCKGRLGKNKNHLMKLKQKFQL